MDSESNILRMNEAVYTWSDSVAEVDSNSESAGRFKPTNKRENLKNVSWVSHYHGTVLKSEMHVGGKERHRFPKLRFCVTLFDFLICLSSHTAGFVLGAKNHWVVFGYQ